MTESLAFLPFQDKEGCILLFVKLTPRGAHNRIQGLFFDPRGQAFLKISITAPPVDGQANKALIKFLGGKLGIAPSTLSLIRGETDRYKVISMSKNDVNLQHLQQTLLP